MKTFQRYLPDPGTYLFIPGEVAPFEAFHPETVKMENRKRNMALFKSINKAVYRSLVVVGGKGCGKP